jgi:hypothetical protein
MVIKLEQCVQSDSKSRFCRSDAFKMQALQVFPQWVREKAGRSGSVCVPFVPRSFANPGYAKAVSPLKLDSVTALLAAASATTAPPQSSQCVSADLLTPPLGVGPKLPSLAKAFFP